MDRFYEILRKEVDIAFSDGGAYANKNRAMQAFDKAFAIAVAKYAREKGIDLT